MNISFKYQHTFQWIQRIHWIHWNCKQKKEKFDSCFWRPHFRGYHETNIRIFSMALFSSRNWLLATSSKNLILVLYSCHWHCSGSHSLIFTNPWLVPWLSGMSNSSFSLSSHPVLFLWACPQICLDVDISPTNTTVHCHNMTFIKNGTVHLAAHWITVETCQCTIEGKHLWGTFLVVQNP